MGPDMTTWQMVVEVEREIAVGRAARFGTLGAPPPGGNRIANWLRRRSKPSPAVVPTSATRRPAREGGA